MSELKTVLEYNDRGVTLWSLAYPGAFARAELRHSVLRAVYRAMSNASRSSENRAVLKPSSTAASTLIFRTHRTSASAAASSDGGSLAHSR